MKLACCQYRDDFHLGIVQDDCIMLPSLDPAWSNHYPDVLALIDAGAVQLQQLAEFIAAKGASIAVGLDEVRLRAPIPAPRKNVICMGWNYKDHIAETTAEMNLPKYPILFTKAASCVTGPYDDIPHDPEISDRMDWEVELGVVIGREGHKLSKQDALDYVFGYTVINDITARELQKKHKQFYLGKSLPSSCPMGPVVVTADEIPNPQMLKLESRVDGVLKQQASTASQIFDVAAVIATISKTPALAAGDIIATGTPSGVGYARNPPEYLRPGNIVTCEIEKIGRLSNKIVAAQ